MANYANENFEAMKLDYETLTTTANIKNTVPDNLNQVQKLNEFVQETLEEKHKQENKGQDTRLERFKSRNIDFMGPLSRLWSLIEKG